MKAEASDAAVQPCSGAGGEGDSRREASGRFTPRRDDQLVGSRGNGQLYGPEGNSASDGQHDAGRDFIAQLKPG